MSHQPERKEKDCLSCGAEVQGRFCQVCGQENIVPRQNFWSLTQHFIYDIFHFDGKFFDTLKQLTIHPGRVPKEYMAGKRVQYLDPIRMYLFTSAVFFLIFFSFQTVKVSGDVNEKAYLTKLQRLEVATDLNMQLKQGHTDSTYKQAIATLLDSTLRVRLTKQTTAAGDSVILFRQQPYRWQAHFDSTDIKYKQSLAEENWFRRQLLNKIVGKDRTYEDPNEGAKHFIEKVLQRLPTLLFISLPLFAVILKLLYIRRKQLYYSDHSIFTLYHYIFSFLLILVTMGVAGLANRLQLPFLRLFVFGLLLWWLIYLFKGMKVFYEQSWLKTFGKFILLNLLGLFSLIALFLLFALLTALFS